MPMPTSLATYDPQWPLRYAAEAARVRPAFGDNLMELHHVGSTAVPGLAAKLEIDMLAVVRSADLPAGCIEGLRGLGYRRGGDLSPGHLFFKRDVDGVRTHKLHVCAAGHRSIGEMLTFRDRLRGDQVLRKQYEELKRRLVREAHGDIAAYLDAKAPFIHRVVGRTQKR